MQMSDIPFGTTDWENVPETIHPGETGTATWRTREFGDIRVRIVEYSPGYLADHWCSKGSSSRSSFQCRRAPSEGISRAPSSACVRPDSGSAQS